MANIKEVKYIQPVSKWSDEINYAQVELVKIHVGSSIHVPNPYLDYWKAHNASNKEHFGHSLKIGHKFTINCKMFDKQCHKELSEQVDKEWADDEFII